MKTTETWLNQGEAQYLCPDGCTIALSRRRFNQLFHEQ